MTAHQTSTPIVFKRCPNAYRVSVVAAVTFVGFMLGSWIGFGALPSIYSRWLEISRPITDAAAEIAPSVDSVTHYLEQRKDPDTVAGIRNLLAIDFALLFFFAAGFTVATCVDLLGNPGLAKRNVVFVTPGYSINKALPSSALIVLVAFVPLYFDIRGMARPWLIMTGGFSAAIYDYSVVFGAGGWALFTFICLGASIVVVKAQARAKHQR